MCPLVFLYGILGFPMVVVMTVFDRKGFFYLANQNFLKVNA